MEEQMGRQEITNFRKALDWLMIKNQKEKPKIREKTTYEYVGLANPTLDQTATTQMNPTR